MESVKMSRQQIWKQPRPNSLETLGCISVTNAMFGQKYNRKCIQKFSEYSLKSNPCSPIKRYNHNLGNVGFKFFLNKLRLVLYVTKFA